jgi:hypothetical protein
MQVSVSRGNQIEIAPTEAGKGREAGLIAFRDALSVERRGGECREERQQRKHNQS